MLNRKHLHWVAVHHLNFAAVADDGDGDGDAEEEKGEKEDWAQPDYCLYEHDPNLATNVLSSDVLSMAVVGVDVDIDVDVGVVAVVVVAVTIVHQFH